MSECECKLPCHTRSHDGLSRDSRFDPTRVETFLSGAYPRFLSYGWPRLSSRDITRPVTFSPFRYPTDEFSPVCLPLALVAAVASLIELYMTFSRLLPDRIARRISPGTPITIDGQVDGPSKSRATCHLDTTNVLCVHRVSTPPVSMGGSSGSRATHSLTNILRVRRVGAPPVSMGGPSGSRATDSLANILRVHRVSSPPVSMSGPSGPRKTHHLVTPDVLHVYHVSSCGQRASCVPFLQLLLTVWAGPATVNILPDDVLLLIFHFDRVAYLNGLDYVDRLHPSWKWYRLVHVCQSWRSVVFASPNFLDLRLFCGPSTRVELIDIWPPLPIIIKDVVNLPMSEDYDFEAATVHHNRVCEINLHPTSLQLKRLASALQKQFPALIHLMLDFDDYSSRPALAPALPDGLLGGFAPSLQSLKLYSIAFPALPKLLLSATDLVRLTLWNIPHSGYISPEAFVSGLAVLVNLRYLTVKFESPLSRPNRESRRPLPPTRTVLPALTRFEFRGVSEYLENLVARIDAPLLDSIWITFFHQLIFDIPQLAQFTRRTARFQALNEAHVDFDYFGVQVGYLPPTRTFDEKSGLRISCREFDWQLSSLAQVLTSFFSSTYMMERLYIYGPRNLPSQGQYDIENVQWLEIFHPLTSVKNLYVFKGFAQSITPALQDLVRERGTDVLPALECLYLEDFQLSGPVQEAIEKFVSTRQLLGHPVVISHDCVDFDDSPPHSIALMSGVIYDVWVDLYESGRSVRSRVMQ